MIKKVPDESFFQVSRENERLSIALQNMSTEILKKDQIIQSLQEEIRSFDLLRILAQSGLLRRAQLSSESQEILNQFLSDQVSNLISSSKVE